MGSQAGRHRRACDRPGSDATAPQHPDSLDNARAQTEARWFGEEATRRIEANQRTAAHDLLRDHVLAWLLSPGPRAMGILGIEAPAPTPTPAAPEPPPKKRRTAKRRAKSKPKKGGGGKRRGPRNGNNATAEQMLRPSFFSRRLRGEDHIRIIGAAAEGIVKSEKLKAPRATFDFFDCFGRIREF